MVDGNRLGVELRKARERRNLTQAGLAELTGLTVNYLCLVEHGRRGVSIEVLDRIAMATGTSAAFFLVHGVRDEVEDPALARTIRQMRTVADCFASAATPAVNGQIAGRARPKKGSRSSTRKPDFGSWIPGF